MEKFKDIVEGSENTLSAHNLTGGAYVNGKLFLFNSGLYLMKRAEIEAIQQYCAEYLAHINEDDVLSYNQQLRESRLAEREAFNKSNHHKSKPSDTFIYVILNKANGFYKIGRSKKPSNRRYRIHQILGY